MSTLGHGLGREREEGLTAVKNEMGNTVAIEESGCIVCRRSCTPMQIHIKTQANQSHRKTGQTLQPAVQTPVLNGVFVLANESRSRGK